MHTVVSASRAFLPDGQQRAERRVTKGSERISRSCPVTDQPFHLKARCIWHPLQAEHSNKTNVMRNSASIAADHAVRRKKRDPNIRMHMRSTRNPQHFDDYAKSSPSITGQPWCDRPMAAVQPNADLAVEAEIGCLGLNPDLDGTSLASAANSNGCQQYPARLSRERAAGVSKRA